MTSLLTIEVGFWDYITFAVLFVCLVLFLVFLVWLAGLPGKIAIARKHPDAEAVKIMGYAGFLPLVPWMQAFVWAFKPTNPVDIRRFPREEAKAIDETIARLTGQTGTPSPQATERKKSDAKSGQAD
jgi:hypothetical protein